MPKSDLQVPTTRPDLSLLTADDIYLFNEGSHYRIYDKLGAHLTTVGGERGTTFGVWAPNAHKVSVIGDFNGWDTTSHKLYPRGDSGIWEGFIPGLGKGTLYKFHIVSNHQGYTAAKADPFGVVPRSPSANRIGSLGSRLRLGRRRVDESARP